MTSERVERRLAAVLAADVAGYSRLMGTDEEGTLARLKSVRKAIVDTTIAAHRGRIVKTTGDGMLVEFASAVDAVTCAVEVQRAMAKQNEAVPQDTRVEFRIGINVGDIIIDSDDDIFGDGVNVAARVESHCEPGGVCVSSNAFEQIRGKTNFTFNDLGEVTLKNIERPVRLYAVGGAASIATWTTTTVSPMSSDSRKPLPLPDKPSIAVLPFQNMSGDPEQEYFSDGMVDDIITALCRFKSIFVIARNSSFVYKGRAVDIRQVGRELGVRYVLEGSLRKAAGSLRITGQLIDASDGSHLWADKFDGPLDDIFDLQDKITTSVVAAIAPSLERAEIARSARKPSESLDAFDCYYRAAISIRQRTRDGNDETLRLAKRAIELDPNFAAAHGLAAHCYMQRKIAGWKIDDSQVSEGKRYALRAVELGADDAYALSIAAQYNGFVLKDAETADAIIDQAIAVNPNLFIARFLRGWISSWMGKHEAAVDQFHYAIRLNPVDPQMFLAEGGMAIALLFLHRFDEALAWNTRALARNPNYEPGLRYSPVMYAMLGRINEAQSMLARLRQLGGYLSISELKEYLSYKRSEDVALIVEGYRLAGETN